MAATLRTAGPDARTACGEWTTGELAIHLALGELRYAVLTIALARTLVARGVRIDRAGDFNERMRRRYRARGWEWALEMLSRPPQFLLTLGWVGTVTLMEIWTHHEDVLLANPGAGAHAAVDLGPVVRFLRRYQRSVLAGAEDDLPDGDDATLVRLLSGRARVGGLPELRL